MTTEQLIRVLIAKGIINSDDLEPQQDIFVAPDPEGKPTDLIVDQQAAWQHAEDMADLLDCCIEDIQEGEEARATLWDSTFAKAEL